MFDSDWGVPILHARYCAQRQTILAALGTYGWKPFRMQVKWTRCKYTRIKQGRIYLARVGRSCLVHLMSGFQLPSVLPMLHDRSLRKQIGTTGFRHTYGVPAV